MTRLTNKQKKLVGFKLTLGFTSLVVVLVGWILQLIVFNNQTPYFDNLTHKTGKQINYFLQNRMVFSLNYFSFFTIESNLLCILLLLVAGFRPRLEGKIKLLRTRFVLAVTVYIAMTGLVFDVFLLQEFARGVVYLNLGAQCVTGRVFSLGVAISSRRRNDERALLGASLTRMGVVVPPDLCDRDGGAWGGDLQSRAAPNRGGATSFLPRENSL